MSNFDIPCTKCRFRPAIIDKVSGSGRICLSASLIPDHISDLSHDRRGVRDTGVRKCICSLCPIAALKVRSPAPPLESHAPVVAKPLFCDDSKGGKGGALFSQACIGVRFDGCFGESVGTPPAGGGGGGLFFMREKKRKSFFLLLVKIS